MLLGSEWSCADRRAGSIHGITVSIFSSFPMRLNNHFLKSFQKQYRDIFKLQDAAKCLNKKQFLYGEKYLTVGFGGVKCNNTVHIQ